MDYDYELTILFKSELNDNLKPALDKVKKIIEDAGGKIIKEENDGIKRLAYAINNREEAIYYFYNVQLGDLANSKAATISSNLNLNDDVLRYLLVRANIRKH